MTTMEIDKKIEKFIKAHHVLTLATATNDGEPYCCNCFFAYDNESAAFIFTSGKETHHAQMMGQNNRVAASIVLETRTVRHQKLLFFCLCAQLFMMCANCVAFI